MHTLKCNLIFLLNSLIVYFTLNIILYNLNLANAATNDSIEIDSSSSDGNDTYSDVSSMSKVTNESEILGQLKRYLLINILIFFF